MCVVQATFDSVEIAECFMKLRKRFTSELDLIRLMNDGAVNGLTRFSETIEQDEKILKELQSKPVTVRQNCNPFFC